MFLGVRFFVLVQIWRALLDLFWHKDNFEILMSLRCLHVDFFKISQKTVEAKTFSNNFVSCDSEDILQYLPFFCIYFMFLYCLKTNDFSHLSLSLYVIQIQYFFVCLKIQRFCLSIQCRKLSFETIATKTWKICQFSIFVSAFFVYSNFLVFAYFFKLPYKACFCMFLYS